MLTLAIPCVRRYDLLQGLLDSVERGTRQPDRYVIIDNGDKIDDHKLRLPSNTDLLRPGANLGVSATWNVVMRACPDYVVFSNDDVLFDAELLERFERAAITSDATFIFPKTADSTTFCVFLIKHACYEKVGPFDERFWPAYYEDCDYHRRIKAAGIKELTFEGAGYEHIANGYLKAMTPEENAEFQKHMERNHAYYIQKWGGPPGGETRLTPADVP